MYTVNSIQPIKPSEVQHKIPDQIIQAVNGLIQRNWTGKSARIYQKEILDIVSSEDPNDPRPSSDTIFERHYLDIEDTYRKVGWEVEYMSPEYNESWDPYFIFSKPSK